MKRLIALLLCFVSIFMCMACAADSTKANVINFYYCSAEITYNTIKGVIAAEPREQELKRSDLLSVLNLYMEGPSGHELKSPFPTGSAVVSVQQNENTLYLNMNQTFGKLTGLELTLACACLCKTATEITQLSTVQISCQDVLLDGNTTITLNADDMIWLDTAQATEP